MSEILHYLTPLLRPFFSCSTFLANSQVLMHAYLTRRCRVSASRQYLCRICRGVDALEAKGAISRAANGTANTSIRQLIALLCHLPSMKFLLLEKDSIGWNFEEGEDGGDLETIPPCSLLCLKSVEFKKIHGNRYELYLVKYLLKNAIALEKMTIISSSTLSADPMKQLKITKQLLVHPSGSTCGQINFL
ncbi:hypothetical protein IFM89_002371 [Coptis chinensis]|uniref:FBD domain-containing protein n=1 Tax=Coptis chinensis TaxID=261450 RepID=A0A835IIW3_9MAGN|nr:hypothetical protein IFM89_002371 [Coptis chinensis]